jgi:ABC-type polysaccharide/polyol phosphate export permease
LPKSIFVVAALGSGLVNLVISQGALIILMLMWQQPFYFTWWFFPVATLLLTFFTFGVGLFMAALALHFTDVIEMYQLALQILFWFTPVVYPRSAVTPIYQSFINLNPLFHLLELFRTPIYYGWLPGPYTVTAALGMTLIALLLGWWFYMYHAEQITYRL